MEKVNKVIGAYIKLRDMKTDMERRHKEELAKIKEEMERIEMWLQRALLAEGAESIKTAEGTAFLQSATSATVKDWSAALDYIRDNNEWSLLEARVNKTAIKDFIESNGSPPPGIDFNTTLVTRVRR